MKTGIIRLPSNSKTTVLKNISGDTARLKSKWSLKPMQLLLPFIALTIGCTNYSPAFSQQSQDNPADRFNYVVDGDFSKQVHIPTYEWISKENPPKAIIFACHGLTLHGKTFEVTGRTFAAHGFYFIAPDMRGFGRCYQDPDNKFSDAKNNRHIVNYEKSTDEFICVAKALKERYPNTPIILLAESSGCSTATRMAATSPETFYSLILSAPAMRLNPLMFIDPKCVLQYTVGFYTHLNSGISMDAFFKDLVSNDPQVVSDALADPLIRKKLHPCELIKTLSEVRHTDKYAKKLKEGIPVLVIQGSDDKCVSPASVTMLAQHIRSEDQTIRWFYSYGHLAFETNHLRSAVVNALMSWFRERQPAYVPALQEMEKEINALGGTVR